MSVLDVGSHEPATPRYARTEFEIALDSPVVYLDYGESTLLQTQDAITNCVAVDLYCDLHIDTVQPTSNTLVFCDHRDLLLATVYMSKYHRFTVRCVN